MTRDAQIRQTAAEWLRYNHPTCTQDMLVEAFRCGAEWADRNQPSPWHKASEELPPISEPRDESADCVLAVLGRQVKIGGKMYLTGFYDHEVRDWHIYGNGYSKLTNLEVIDWMLLNKPKS